MVSKPEGEADSIPHRGPGGGGINGGIKGSINGGAKEGGNDDREEHQDRGDVSRLTLGHDQYDGDDDDDGDGDVFRIPGKNPPTAALRRWRKAALVLNAARRFRYTADLAARAQRKLLKFRASVRAVMAVNQLALIASPRPRELATPLIIVDDSAIKPTNIVDDDNAIAPTMNIVDDVKLAGLARDHDAEALKEAGGVQGVLRYLGIANPDEGVPGADGGELERRRLRFGANTYPRPPPRSFLSFVLDACKDLTLIILMVCAVLTLTLGLKTHGTKEGWYDGAAIGFAVLLVVSVTSISDYHQSLQFSALNDEKRNIKVDVVRAGRRQEVSIFDLVVGDIVVLGIGDQVGYALVLLCFCCLCR
jgi:Ca2+-transporting ATPase